MLYSSFGHLLRDSLINANSLRSFSFSHKVREGNAMAHALDERVRLSFPLLVWMETVPPNVDAFVFANFQLLNQILSMVFSSLKKKATKKKSDKLMGKKILINRRGKMG